jgi:hypothetical protein
VKAEHGRGQKLETLSCDKQQKVRCEHPISETTLVLLHVAVYRNDKNCGRDDSGADDGCREWLLPLEEVQTIPLSLCDMQQEVTYLK